MAAWDNLHQNVRGIHAACWTGNLQVVKRELDRDVNERKIGTKSEVINSLGENNETPVMVAARKGFSDIVEFLIREGADLSLMDRAGNTVLHHACERGNVETVKLILAQNNMDVNARNKDGKTAADVAKAGGHRHVEELLRRAAR